MHETKKLTLGGLLIGLVAIATMAINIPMPTTGGYIHLGDSMIYLIAILFGGKFGALAGGVGSAMANILSGYSQWALFTLIIKGLMGLIIGKIAFMTKEEQTLKLKHILGVLIGAIWMIAGYYFAEGIMVGSLIVPLQSITWNVIQSGMGAIIAFPILFALLKTELIEDLESIRDNI
ncbi:ECF transporter S component [Natroniella sulfidigena]|uniref:ECF transporter S component n=1 Tax=Natroniella sulfidigena TaxID=723921 RepID=UPI00200B5456|nr:ECF transporter S component [Natroniella sulfidigena]MCK8817262.1 ECF transporter S component [Natroniella sulfidigena]